MDWDLILAEQALRDLTFVPVILNLVLVLFFGQILAWHYRRYAQVLSNKRKFARLFLFLAATTMMVISVVKTSLALSLGLVGALSIIRFRTPIKEPEDLAYLFLALAVGIGLGADQRWATAIMFGGILIAITIRNKLGRQRGDTPRIYVNVTVPTDSEENCEQTVKRLMERVKKLAREVSLRRVDVESGLLNVTMILDLGDSSQMAALASTIQEVLPKASVNVMENNSLD